MSIADSLRRLQTVSLVLGAFVVAVSSPGARAQVIATWNGVSGNWTNPALWSTNPNYPNNGNPLGTTYNVKASSPSATLTVDVPITIQQLDATAGNFSGAGTLTVVGPTNLGLSAFNVPLTTGSLRFGSSGSGLNGTGPVTVIGGMTVFDTTTIQGSGAFTVGGGLSLDGFAPLALDGRSLTLTGGASSWTGGSIDLRNGAVFTIGSGATLTSGRTFGVTSTAGTPAARPKFAVNGTYIVDAFGFTTEPIVPGITFTNSGTIDIRSNPSAFATYDGLSNTGRVRVAAGNAWAGSITSSGANAVVTGAGLYQAGESPTALVFNAGARLAPGDGVGSMQVAVPITMAPGSIFEAELGGPIPTAYDQLMLTPTFGPHGSIALNGSSLNTLLEYAPSPTDVLTIITGGAVTNTFAGLPNGTEFYVGRFNNTDYVGTINYTPTSVVLSNIHPIPEPAAWLLAGVAGAAWAWRRRLRRRSLVFPLADAPVD